MYVAPRKPGIVRPRKELKAIAKVELESGHATDVQFEITDEMFRYFDADKHEWVTDKGVYDLYVGTASDNLPTKITYTVK